jgi:hypothetical protein
MRRLDFHHMLIHESDGRSGGLLLMWKNDVKVIERSVTNRHIDVTIDSGSVWRFTGVYGEPDWRYKEQTWTDLRTLFVCNNLMPWFLVGDFNEILFDSEKEGGLLRPQRYMQNFRDALEDCQLQDMAYIGDRFTWRRRSIRERLDRSICNREWNLLFPLSGSVNEGMTKSDHRPVLIDTTFHEGVEAPNPKSGKRFEARWLNEPSVDEIVRGAWERAKESNQRLINTLADMHTDLHEWDREILKGLKKRIDRVENELQDLRRGPMTDEALV